MRFEEGFEPRPELRMTFEHIDDRRRIHEEQRSIGQIFEG
jgi:hypothetical protein